MDINPIHFLQNVLGYLLAFIESSSFSTLLVIGIVLAIIGVILKVTRKIAKFILPILIILFIIKQFL